MHSYRGLKDINGVITFSLALFLTRVVLMNT